MAKIFTPYELEIFDSGDQSEVRLWCLSNDIKNPCFEKQKTSLVRVTDFETYVYIELKEDGFPFLDSSYTKYDAIEIIRSLCSPRAFNINLKATLIEDRTNVFLYQNGKTNTYIKLFFRSISGRI